MSLTAEILQRVLDALSIGIVLVNEEDDIVVFNPEFGEMLQVDSKSRIGTSILLCHPEVWEAEVTKVISELRRGVRDEFGGWLNFRGRMLYEIIRPMWDEEGECLGLLDQLYDVEDKVELLRRVGEWEDIEVSGVDGRIPRAPDSGSRSALTPTEQILQGILDALDIGVVCTDKNDNIVVFNRMAGHMFQQDPRSRIGPSIPPSDPEVWEPDVKEVIRGLREGVRDEFRGWLNFRGRMLYEIIRPMWDEQGGYLGLLSEVHDVEDKVRLLKRLGEWEDVEVSGAGGKSSSPTWWLIAKKTLRST